MHKLVLIMPQGGFAVALNYFLLQGGLLIFMSTRWTVTLMLEGSKPFFFVIFLEVNEYPFDASWRSFLIRRSGSLRNPCRLLMFLAPEILFLEGFFARFTYHLWSNLLFSFVCSRNLLHMSWDSKPIFIAPVGTLNSLCFATVSLSSYHPLTLGIAVDLIFQASSSKTIS